MKLSFLSFFTVILLFSAGTATAKWHSYSGNQEPQTTKVQILKSDINSTIVSFESFGVEVEPIDIRGKTYTTLTIPGLTQTETQGFPSLPRLSKNFMIPASSEPTVRVLEISSLQRSYGVIAPSKGTIHRNMDPDEVPFEFSKFYAVGGSFPEINVNLNKTFSLRSLQGVGLDFYPVQYNHTTGVTTIITKMIVEILTPTPRAKRFSILAGTPYVDSAFLDLYLNQFSNYEKFIESIGPERAQFIEEQGRLLIITHPNFVQSLQPFVEWKTQKGWFVKTITLSASGATAESIKQAIQTEYDSNHISYVILVGDAEFVPYFVGTSGNAIGNEADPMYALVQGNDSYPDLFVSRFSVKTSADLDTIVAKSIDYEKNPDLNGDWYEKGSGIASDQTDGSGPIDSERADLLRDMLLAWHYKKVDQIYDPNAELSHVVNALNEGRGYINYIGHGSKTSWGTTNFSNSDIDQLANGKMLPFIVSVACVNGDFAEGGDSFAERWLKAGTASSPKGAIAVFASSTNQSWVPPTVGQKEITTILTQQKANTIGGLFTNGVVAVLEDNSSSAQQTFETWHTFGDATLQVRTRKPVTISANVPGVILLGTNSLSLNAGEKGIAAGLVQNGKLIGSGISEDDGSLKIDFLSSVDVGSAKLTLTGFNKIPFMKDLNVVPPNGPYLWISDFKVNGKPETSVHLGETVNLSFNVKNVGSAATTGGTVKIESIDGPATIETESAEIPSVAVGSEIFVASSVSLHVSGMALDGEFVKLNLSWTLNEGQSGTTALNLKVVRGVVAVTAIDFGTNQNESRGINPGQSGNIFLTLKNTGSEPLDDLMLTPQAGRCVDAINGYIHVTTINPGAELRLSAPLNVTVSSTCSNGDAVVLDLVGTYQSVSQKVDLTAEGSFLAGALETHKFEFNNLNLAIPDAGAPVVFPINVTNVRMIEDVSVHLKINHTYIGDLTVKLIHPNGTEIVLHNQTGGSDDNLDQIYGFDGLAVPGLLNLKGLDGKGTWRIQAQDSFYSDYGVIKYIKLSIKSY